MKSSKDEIHDSLIVQQLSLLLKYADFDTARLYLFDRLKREAVLTYVVELGKPGNKVENWTPFNQVSFNYDTLFSKDTPPDNNKFEDLIGLFRKGNQIHDSFVVKDLQNRECSNEQITKFLKEKNINEVMFFGLRKGNDEHVGHIVLDRRKRRDTTISDKHKELAPEFLQTISKFIINSIDEKEAIHHREILKKIIQKIQTSLENTDNLADVLGSVIRMLLESCENIDIAQVKRIEGDQVKYLEIDCNRNKEFKYAFTEEEIEKLRALKENTQQFPIQDGYLITRAVYESKKDIFIPNMITYKAKSPSDFDNLKMKKDDPRHSIILGRNNCEINVPILLGGKVVCILDIHGRWPYSLNNNTFSLVQQLLPWITLLFEHESKTEKKERGKEEEFVPAGELINLFAQIEDTGGTVETSKSLGVSALMGRYGCIIRISNLVDLFLKRDMAGDLRKISSTSSDLMATRKTALIILFTSIVSLVTYQLQDHLLVHPLLSGLGFITMPIFLVMTFVVESKYKHKTSEIFNKIEKTLVTIRTELRNAEADVVQKASKIDLEGSYKNTLEIPKRTRIG